MFHFQFCHERNLYFDISCHRLDQQSPCYTISTKTKEIYLLTCLFTFVSPCCRLDQAGSLQVDSGDTVTARSPGHLTQLNTQPALYLGN